MQTPVYQKLKSKTVRDLYWLLFSESPLSDTYDLSPYALFPQSILNEWQELSVDYFLELDKHPNEIASFVDRKKNKRLGFYAEALLSYFFQTFTPISLLLQNFQIIDKQKTIGEVDFIIAYNEKVIHLECAVKYYLLKDQKHKDKASQWVGPRMKDNLALKLDKLIQHQLPLSSRSEIQEKINRPIDVSYLFLKGIFFAEGKIESGTINRNQAQEFMRLSELNDFLIKPVEILIRPNWLAATSPTTIKFLHDFIGLEKPFIHPELVLFEDKKVRFIVPDNWERNKSE